MRKIAFFEVGDHERAMLDAAEFPGFEVLRFPDQLNAATLDLAADAEIVSVFIYSVVGRDVIGRMAGLKMVSTRSTGFDHIDLDACRERGIVVSNVPSYGENTIAEHAFALLFAIARRLKVAHRKIRDLDFSVAGLQGFDLQGKTLGIVGAGHIGLHAVRIGRGLGMHVVACDPREDADLAEREGFRYVPLDELLRSADVVSLHAALSPSTRHMIDRDALRRMKQTAVLINTARGGLVDTEALCEALHNHWIAGAGLDVFEGEELISEEAELLHKSMSLEQMRELLLVHNLLRYDNVVLTPHSAFFTREGVGRLVQTALDNIRAYIAGSPQNVVSTGG